MQITKPAELLARKKAIELMIMMRRVMRTPRALPASTRALQSQAAAAAKEAPSFQFKCTQCGKCCTGKGGRVRVNDREIEELQRVLQLSTAELKDRYLSPTEDAEDEQWLIKQTEDDTQCVFLDGKRCSVYEARPTQCRTFPWWPQNMISSYDWQLAARSCEGIELKESSSSGGARRLQDVLPEAIVYDIHRSGENYTYDELHDMLRDLQELDPSFLDEYVKELREKFHRRVVYQDNSVTVLDTFLEGVPPSRSFVFNDRLHLVQSEMELREDGDSVDPSTLVLDVHQAMHTATEWLLRRKTHGWSVALLGSGGGSLVRHILHCHGDAVALLDAVEPSATVNQVARQFFGLDEAGNALTLHEAFGEDFVQRQLACNISERRLYDLFFIDVEAGSPGDGVLAPPLSMLSPGFLDSVRELLSDVGIVTINVITEDEDSLRQVAAAVARAFGANHCVFSRLPKNTVIFAFKDAAHNHKLRAENALAITIESLSQLL